MTERQRFAVPDQLTCYYDRPAEPANVHVEVRVPGRLDEGALRGSVQAVLASEPGVRARRARAGGWRRSYYWEFPPVPDADPVRVAAHADRAVLDAQRDAFLSLALPLDIAPPLRFLLTSGTGGDSLILNAHHARFDGLACLRLLHMVADEYGRRAARSGPATSPADAGHQAAGEQPAGRPEPGPPAARGTTAGSAGAARAGRGTTAGPAGAARAGRGTTARIAPAHGGHGDMTRPGYGAHLLSWDGLAAAGPRRPAAASINDLLIAALMLTISDWNEGSTAGGGRAGGGRRAGRGGRGGGRIRITMPVGDRSQAGPDGQWANLSRLTAVTAQVRPWTPPAALLGEVTRQTREAKEHPGPQVDLASRVLAGAPVPVTAKNIVLRAALRVAGALLCDTSLVSNLGSVDAPAFGALTATQVWFSTSAHMPRGLSLGAVTVGGRLCLTFRYRRALFAAADAAEFAGRYAKTLDQLAGVEGGSR